MFDAKKLLVTAGMATVSVLVLAGCSINLSGPATGEPLLVQGNSSLEFVPEAPAAAQAVFDDYNAVGGLNGRPIQYSVCNDMVNPTVSAACTATAISQGTIAMVGSASLIDCLVNSSTWEENTMVSFQGTGLDPYCFTTPNVASANAGPFFDAQATLSNAFASDAKKVCVIATAADPQTRSAYDQTFAQYSQSSGNKLTFVDNTTGFGADYTAAVTSAIGRDCDSMVLLGLASDMLTMLDVMTALDSSVPVFMQTSVYGPEFAQAPAVLGYGGTISAVTDFMPFTGDNDNASDDWKAVMEAHDVPLTAFAQGGYLAAKNFIKVLEAAKGDITATAVTEAAKAMSTPEGDPMRGNSWIFGSGPTHQTNTSTWQVVIKPGSGVWTSADSWVSGADIGWVDTTAPQS
jgi:branched-chain amino acid transport system substrate-binding protein